jgi:hypothetical protein
MNQKSLYVLYNKYDISSTIWQLALKKGWSNVAYPMRVWIEDAHTKRLLTKRLLDKTSPNKTSP